MTEWQSGTGKWLCGDVSALAAGSNLWWYVPRLLNISCTDYILLLKEKYNVTDFHFSIEKNVLIFSFNTLSDCRKFKNYINKIAKERNFIIY